MKPPVSAFTTIYAEWLDSFRALLPGGSHMAQASDVNAKAAQTAAQQEWEDEGGSIKPEKASAPAQATGPKIPF